MVSSRNAFRWPFQDVTRVELSPRCYQLRLRLMSKETVEFLLPLNCTVSPCNPFSDRTGFQRYAQSLARLSPAQVAEQIESIVHAETRVLASGMTVMEMFGDREKFRAQIVTEIQKEFDKFGMVMHIAGVAEMSDVEGNKYFAFTKQHALTKAENEARAKIAENMRKGFIAEQEQKARGEEEAARIQKDLAERVNVLETARVRTDTNRAIAVAQMDMERRVREAETSAAADRTREEQQATVQVQRAISETERLRAELRARATAEADAVVAQARGAGEATRIRAEASAAAVRIKAEAVAHATKIRMEAEAEGLRQKMAACGGDVAVVQYLETLQSGALEKIAATNASGLQGMQPKVYMLGAGGAGAGDPVSRAVQGLFQLGVPAVDMLLNGSGKPASDASAKVQ